MKDREKWMELCEQASREQDPKKLMPLTAEIIRLLDEKKNRVTGSPARNPVLRKNLVRSEMHKSQCKIPRFFLCLFRKSGQSLSSVRI